MAFFKKLKEGLAKTRNAFSESIDNVFKAFVRVDEDLFEELCDTLIMADIGAVCADEITEELRDRVKEKRITQGEEVKAELIEIIREKLGEEKPLDLENKPAVILVMGVNGAGKTTSIGKLAAQMKAQGKNVLLAAADTFRAAAIDQLCVWGERAGVPIVRGNEGQDPASVIFDACHAAKNRGVDVLICDTAGRLQNKKNLMEELKKIYKIIDKELPGVSKECILVLDAGTGQNAVSQAELFAEVAPLTGIILTKLDGTAKGGIIISIAMKLNIPVKYIGIGEGIDDLQEFSPKDFADAIFEKEQ